MDEATTTLITETLTKEPKSDLYSDKTLTTYLELCVHPEAELVTALFSETLEKADEALEKVKTALQEVKGASLVHEVARNNLIKQSILFLTAAQKIIEDGSATISVFGRFQTFHSLSDIENGLTKVADDFDQVAQLPVSFTVFQAETLPIIDKYLFDGRNIEAAKTTPVSILVLEDPLMPGLGERMKEWGILPEVGKEGAIPLKSTEVETLPAKDNPRLDIQEGKYQSFRDYLDQNPYLGTEGKSADIIVVDVGSDESFRYNHYIYQQLFADYWRKFPLEKRPVVIMVTEDFPEGVPLYHRHDYEGFLFCRGGDDLRNTLYLAQDLVALREKPAFLEPAVLSSAQEKLYNNSDLREWEEKTADTYQSLRHILEIFNQRAKAAKKAERRYFSFLDSFEEEVHNPWDLEIKTVLDCGTGEGRIGGALARLGYHVMGIDISQTQLDRIPERLKQEGEGLKGKRQYAGLSYHALKQLAAEGVVKSFILPDKEAANYHLPVKGNFLELNSVLSQTIKDWEKKFPGVDKRQFFDISPSDQYAFSDPRDYFADAGFDAVLFNWHTFCEAGSIDNMKDLLRQVLNILDLGGQLIIEIPDRSVGPYAKSLEAYHEKHPKEPLGTIKDTTSTKPGVATETATEEDDTPRFFPDRNELIELLVSLGYIIDPKKDVQTYLVTNTDPQTNETHLQVKELFMVAQKAWH